MQPEAPAQKPRRYRHLVRWIFIGILAILGWYGWKAYDFRRAVKEAKELGWRFEYTGPIEHIRIDWKNAFRRETWKSASRDLYISRDNEFEGRSVLFRRLNPTQMSIRNTFSGRDLSELSGLSKLTELELWDCPNLTNIDTLKDIKGLVSLSIAGSPSLTNIDALKELTGMVQLGLYSCTALTNLNALKDLKALNYLSLYGCAGIENLDGILGLTELQQLNLNGCRGITKESLFAVATARPDIKITSEAPE